MLNPAHTLPAIHSSCMLYMTDDCQHIHMFPLFLFYSQVHKYWDIDTILTFLALYTTTMDFKWNEQDVL